jgi:hypothetical protein
MVEIREFLAHHHLAVLAGDATDPLVVEVLDRLHAAGHQVDVLAGDAVTDASRDATLVGVGGLLALDAPTGSAVPLVQRCAAAGVPRLWVHRRVVVRTDVHDALHLGRVLGVVVIDGTCPLLFVDRVPTRRTGGRVRRPLDRWVRR